MEPKELNMNNCIYTFTFTDYTTPLYSKIIYSLYNKDNKPVLVVENINTCYQTRHNYIGKESILSILDEELKQWDDDIPSSVEKGISKIRDLL